MRCGAQGSSEGAGLASATRRGLTFAESSKRVPNSVATQTGGGLLAAVAVGVAPIGALAPWPGRPYPALGAR